MSEEPNGVPRALISVALPIALVFGLAQALQFARSRNYFRPEPPLKVPPVRFEDVTERMGMKYFYRPPNLGTDPKPRTIKYIIAPGVVVADFNGDGYMDVFVPNGDAASPSALYLNQGGKGFKDAAKAWGVDHINAGHSSAISAAVIDFNRDGRPDLFIAGVGCSRLFRNDGDHFTDVSARSKATDCRNSQGAIPFDVNNDGWPDLYVFRYFRDIDLFDSSSDDVLKENTFDARNG
ncbi:MAG TPA: VCBS repeat-containing protein, partial [Elusimicrobiota bacterium]|nr:VCBS repeat-containing protein [Elusimicrobiota bacterium]